MAGQFGIKNFGSYQCIIYAYLDKQNKCLMWYLENDSRDNKGQASVLDVFTASLVALDLTISEINEFVDNLESSEKKNSGRGCVNVLSNKNNTYIVVTSTNTSVSIFASDTKLF